MSFEFLREGRVWLEYNSNFYLLHTMKDITFSQTFRQEDIPARNLFANTDFFEGSSIVEANPADFSFTIYLIANDSVSPHQHLPLDLLIDYSGSSLNTFNLYFVYSDNNPEIYYKVENCVFTSGSFNIPRNGLMKVGLSGQGTRLTRTSGAFPGTVLGDYEAAPEYAISKEFDIWATESGVSPATDPEYKLDNILGASLELQNNISWTPNKTVQASLAVTDASNTIYPTSFTLENRSLAGSIQQYVDESNALSKDNVQTWAENTSVVIKAGLASNNYQFELDLEDKASFTNRTNFGEVFTQNYDFRLMANPTTTIFTY